MIPCLLTALAIAAALTTPSAKMDSAVGGDSARAFDDSVAVRIEARRAGDPRTLDYAARAVTLRERDVPRVDSLLAHSLVNYAFCLRTAGQLDSAVTTYSRAIGLLESTFGANDNRLTNPLNSLCATYRLKGDFARGRAALLRALHIRELHFGPESVEAARLLMNVGLMDVDSGDLLAAREHYERSWRIKQQHAGPHSVQAGLTLINLGEIASMLGDKPLARLRYEESLSILSDSLPRGSPETQMTRLDLANVLLETGAVAEARRHLARARAEHDSAGKDEPLVSAQLLGDEGSLAAQDGDFARAEHLYRSEIAELVRAHGSAHPDVATAHHLLGDALLRAGLADSARAQFALEAEIVAASLGTDHPDYARALRDRARADLAAGAMGLAIDHALESERISRNWLRIVLQGTPEQLGLGLVAGREQALDVALTALDRDPASRDTAADRVLDAVVRSRGLVLDEIAERGRVVSSSSDSGITSLHERFLEARQGLANLYVRGLGGDSPEAYRRRISAAAVRRVSVEESLAVVSRAFRRRQATGDAGLAAVRAALSHGVALVSYTVHREEGSTDASLMSAFVITRGDHSCREVSLGRTSAIDSLVRRWRKAVREGPPSVAARAGALLRRRVWDPLAIERDSVRLALVVPDGPLQLVNFSALPARGGGYLLERNPTISYLASEKDIARMEGASGGGGALLAMGGIDYDHAGGLPTALAARVSVGGDRGLFRGATTACTDFTDLHCGPLPGSLAEVRTIESLWNARRGAERATVLTGSSATETAFKLLAERYGTIHLATHGFLLADKCGGDGRSSDDGTEVETAENPLLRSGFMLAGADQRARAARGQDDGVVTAEEIAAMNLTGVDLVVLSACESGIGSVVRGEGIFGLRRAFQVAGARKLVTSLWSVDDVAAQRWMELFYAANLGSGVPMPEAVRSAALGMLREQRRRGRESPAAWGAFIAAGDWR